MDDEGKLDLQKLIGILANHKGLAIAVFTVILSLSIYLAYSLPDVYRSRAAILYVPQELPDTYVQPTVMITMQERVHAITREILSRARLKKVIQDLDLYGNEPALTMGDRISKMRENIDVDAEEGKNEFTLSFESRSPAKAKEVVARLASVYVEETYKLGEEQAKETTAFMQVEAEGLKGEVERLEQRVNRYKAKHRYELPGQLNLNLMTLDRRHTERQNNMLRIAAIQDSKANLEAELIAIREQGGDKVFNRMDHVDKMKMDLETLLSRYGHRHPDVIRKKREIEAIEAGGGIEPPPVEADTVRVHLERDPVKKMLLIQIQELDTETRTLQAKNKLLLDKVTLYQSRVNNTSLRAIELSKLTRTYKVTQQKYEDIHRKILESKLAESMQKKRMATRFQILDPAYLPSKPSRPKRPRIVIMGLILGLAASFGLSILLEAISTTIKNADELKAAVDLPLLASIPMLKTRGNILEKRRRQLVGAMLCVGTIGLGAALIRLYSQYIY